jgi:hypothetical protein
MIQKHLPSQSSYPNDSILRNSIDKHKKTKNSSHTGATFSLGSGSLLTLTLSEGVHFAYSIYKVQLLL